MIGDLFGVGTETTTTTLTWAILYMSLNCESQDRCQVELDGVIGEDLVPRMYHRALLPFTEACLLEIQRLGDIVPLGVPHAVTDDVHFRGYFIPKGTMILANMYGLHADPDLWSEPETFNPDRFLSDDGKIVNKEQLMPFSIVLITDPEVNDSLSEPVQANPRSITNDITDSTYLVFKWVAEKVPNQRLLNLLEACDIKVITLVLDSKFSPWYEIIEKVRERKDISMNRYT
ncbi:hypothetical protein LSH36_321g07104 [Paralvinella palmiformis]|uniref:Cytochrome P450 n=1 Tax=Paralvinella palmiformis TaxID=53620 RepID=A0AAD9N0K8_9ANNE|nr:hypothetical protein LSH36_321g07104 [Paralvinella palmiformis]